MSTFPALKPATRRYSMGVFPVTEERGFGGGSIRFKHGTTAYSHTLNLTFIALTSANAKLLRDHYRGQQGGMYSFALSNEAWVGHTNFTDLVPLTTVWRYASAPEETHLVTGHITINVSLVSVPNFVPASTPGLTISVTAQLNAGTATGV